MRTGKRNYHVWMRPHPHSSIVDCSQLQETKRRPWIFIPVMIQLLNTVKIQGVPEVLTCNTCSESIPLEVNRYIPWKTKVIELEKFQIFQGKVCETWISVKTPCEI